MDKLELDCKKIELYNFVPIKTYLRFAIPLGIALSDEKARSWVYSSLIQLKCKKDNSQIMIVFDKIPNLKIKVKFIYKGMQDKSGKIIKHIEKNIDKGYCVSLILDQYYVPGSPNYLSWHYKHREFIVGYNKKKQTFILQIFGKEGYITETEVPFDDFIKAVNWGSSVKKRTDRISYIYYYKRKEHIIPRFNYFCFYSEMECYAKSKMNLLCRFVTQKFKVIDRENNFGCSFGFVVHEHLLKLLYDIYQGKESIKIGLIKLDIILAHKNA